ncbi:flagellar type III secretion system pore protein FliP [Tundrisphaera lichenicola]|uniref:flagellar type III secretion system pore protein FliP n=1 Tax=Tundrisphaera lichenicola TaxID=2029860 RepID=UPI003EB8A114
MMRRLGILLLVSAFASPALAGPDLPKPPVIDDNPRPNVPIAATTEDSQERPLDSRSPSTAGLPWVPSTDDFKGLKSVALIGLVSLAPAALLMFTSFLRINIVLILLRQALGSPQVPGNQVLAALALLLSLLVMKPVGQTVYDRAIAPYAAGEITPARAWEEGSRPIKRFMCQQILRTNHGYYLRDLHTLAEPDKPEPDYAEDYPLTVVAPAFLLSELTTALMIGFVIYLPFLVTDLVVSAVLSAMGLFMLPPSLVALPLKLVLFVLADGWLLVATALLRTFEV